jgi:sensor histidine kinase YesM
LDSVAVLLGWWPDGFASKIVFIAVLAIALVVVLRVIPSYINAAAKARELEVEKQSLKLEVQESRISIMLSQMQPHFIFNTLNTIYHLCEIEPKLARSTIRSFSSYLRNNIDNLDRREMIHFEKEFSFVKAYLDIEKVRFDDELQIKFDLPVTNFKLPVLSMQPIVENAVKHGTSKKEGCSELFISTRETENCYEIEIRDTGAGFDMTSQPDGHKHIGISNVRQRLAQLCGGTLTIESKIGEGTTAIIQIPKKENYII